MKSKKIFPGRCWEQVTCPEDLGYSSDQLQDAQAYSKNMATSAVVIVKGGRILKEWGAVDTRHIMFSVRKSFTSALYGNYVEQGIIDLDKTLGDIGIDDKVPLSEEEKQATIRDVIKARSGIYHPVNYSGWPIPERDSHRPGTYFYYNQWDFNVAGSIFEKLTGKKIVDALKSEIAGPIGMENFRLEDGHYFHDGADPDAESMSIHPSFSLRMTAKDMARFGLLMLNKGNWNGQQLIPAQWVEESTRYHSDGTSMAKVDGNGISGYGYMWWVARKYNKYAFIPNVDLPEGAYMAYGSGGHYILIIPDHDMVIVHRVANQIANSEIPNLNVKVKPEEFGHLVDLIMNSRLSGV